MKFFLFISIFDLFTIWFLFTNIRDKLKLNKKFKKLLDTPRLLYDVQAQNIF